MSNRLLRVLTVKNVRILRYPDYYTQLISAFFAMLEEGSIMTMGTLVCQLNGYTGVNLPLTNLARKRRNGVMSSTFLTVVYRRKVMHELFPNCVISGTSRFHMPT